MSWLWHILQAIIVGSLIGAFARLIMPGRQNISVTTTIIVGVLASLVGSVIAGILGVADTKGIDWIELIIQVILAVAFVAYAVRRFPAHHHHHAMSTSATPNSGNFADPGGAYPPNQPPTPPPTDPAG
jgi:uncharacterized membrane protein YeaQ/YmgE (transglycosylase-associated protein family)